MNKKKILFICGSNNQTTMMHEIAKHLIDYECYFTPYYCDGYLKLMYNAGMVDFTVAGRRFQSEAIRYITANNLKLDFEGKGNNYDLVVTCSDLVIQKNIRSKKIVLVQEGMTDPENFIYKLVKLFKIPRYLASTSATGLSHTYDAFCVASDGYREHFAAKGVDPAKVIVTGIPNFDNAEQFTNNGFPYRNFVLAATSDARETYKFENRKKFIKKSVEIAGGRQLIFKLHPNENTNRAIKEIKTYAPGALIYTSGNINYIIANCDVLITKYSSVVYVGLALGKEVYSDFDVEHLKKLIPVQNNGSSGRNISFVCRWIAEDRKFCQASIQEKIAREDILNDYVKLTGSLISA